MILHFNFFEDGEIMTIAESPLPGTTPVEVPADWTKHGTSKYIYKDGALIAREGWVDPIPLEE